MLNRGIWLWLRVVNVYSVSVWQHQLFRSVVIGILMSSPICFAQTINKCEDSRGNVSYSNLPCPETQRKTKTFTDSSRNTKTLSESESGFAKSASGRIIRSGHVFVLKDAVARIDEVEASSEVRVILYPFSLSEEERKLAANALLARGKVRPHQLTFVFSDKQKAKENLSHLRYSDSPINPDRTTISGYQLQDIVRSLSFVQYGERLHFNFSLQGKTGKHYWDLQVSTPIAKQEADSIEIGSSRKVENQHAVKGLISYNSKPVSEITTATPSISIKDTKFRKWVHGYTHDYDETSGKYKVTGLPAGGYNIIFYFLQSGNTTGVAQKPGDYIGSRNFIIDENMADVDIDLNGVIHLTKPIDNLQPQPFDDDRTYESPINIEWAPISEGAIYKYWIVPTDSSQQKISASTHENKIAIQLPAGRYNFTLEANVNDRRIGYLIVHGKGWTGTDLSFAIK